MSKEKTRCTWCGSDPEYQIYHDKEWGVPIYNDRTLFEFLTLEGAQAGLSWLTILKRRSGYYKAFAGFDVQKVARFSEKKIQKLLLNPGIIRNKLKVHATVKNAKHFIEIQKEFGSFSEYQWQFVKGKPIQNKWTSFKEVPVTTNESDVFSKDLKKRGFSFVGSTIMYAYMQAVGMVNDHTVDCFRYREIKGLA